MTKCDTCPVSKSIQHAHRKTADHKATAPLERVCTDIIGGDLCSGDDSDSNSSGDSDNDGDTEGSDAEMDEDSIEPDERAPPAGRQGSGQSTLLCIAASDGLHIEHLDVKTAFLNAPVEEKVWVYHAPGFEENDPVAGNTQALKLRKSLYGLRQSPRNWNATFAQAIESIGVRSIFYDPCIYVYGSGNTYVVLSIYVHDVLLLRVDPPIVKNIREQLMNKFSMANLGSASLVLGMYTEQGDGYSKGSQGSYINAESRTMKLWNTREAESCEE
eukprot:g20047.t1